MKITLDAIWNHRNCSIVTNQLLTAILWELKNKKFRAEDNCNWEEVDRIRILIDSLKRVMGSENKL